MLVTDETLLLNARRHNAYEARRLLEISQKMTKSLENKSLKQTTHYNVHFITAHNYD